jgi:hypothetical protein
MLATLGLLLLSPRAVAEPPAPWITGPRLARQLEQPITAAWSNLSFREAMASFSATQNLAVAIDRRVDADEPFLLTISGDPLRVAILKIAERKAVGSSLLGPVVYFGPKPSAESLKTLAALRRDEVGKLPTGARKLLTQSRPWSWGDLAEPRNLIAELGKEARVEVKNLDQIPHDLWPANRLPALPWSDRLTLVLVQFGLTFEVSSEGRSISLVPIPDVVEIERTYAGGEQPSVRAKKLAAKVPDARISVDNDKLLVVGREEDHNEIVQLLNGGQVRTTTIKPGRDVYKLNVERLPLEKVLAQLGNMLKLEVKYDREAIQAAGVSLDQLVTFHVENASLDDLLTAALKDRGLTFERKEKKVTIRPTK